jgi:hypothetical protein
LVELSIFNRGFKTEESIEIVLNKSLSYNLIGSNNQDAEILNNKVKIPRIGSSDETTIIFLIEGGEFSPKDVTSCLSKETKGRIVEKFEEIPVTWQIRVTGIIVIFFVIAIAYGAYFLYTDSITLEKRANTDAGKIEQSIAQSTSAIKENLDAIQSTLTKSSATDSVNGWTIPDYYKTTSDPLYQALKSSKIQINVQVSDRKSDFVTATVFLKNDSSESLDVTIQLKSASSVGKIKDHELRKYGLIAIPTKSISQAFKLIIPKNSQIPAEKTIYASIYIEDFKGKTISLAKEILVDI